MAESVDTGDTIDDTPGDTLKKDHSHEEHIKTEVVSKRRRFLNIILFKSLRKRLFPGWRRSKKGVGRKAKSTSDVLTAHHDEHSRGSHFNNKISTSADSIFTRERGHHGSMGMLDRYMEGMDDSQLEEDFFKGKWSTNITANVTDSGGSTAPVDLDCVSGGTSLDTTVARHKMALRPPKKKSKPVRQRASSPSPTLPVLNEPETVASPTVDEINPLPPTSTPVAEIHPTEPVHSTSAPETESNNKPPVVTPVVTMRGESIQRDPTKRQTIATERTIYGERKVNRPSSVHGAPLRDWDTLGQPHNTSATEHVAQTEFAKMFSRVRHNAPQQQADKEADTDVKPVPLIKEEENVKTKAVGFKDSSSASPQGSPAFKRDSPLIKDRGRSQTLPKSNFETMPPSDNQVKVKRVSSHRVTPERRDSGGDESPKVTPKITPKVIPNVTPPIFDTKKTTTTIVIEKKKSPEVVKKSPEVTPKSTTSPERPVVIIAKKSPVVSKRPVESVRSTSPQRTSTEIVIEKKPLAIVRSASHLRKTEKVEAVKTKVSPESSKPTNVVKVESKTSPDRNVTAVTSPKTSPVVVVIEKPQTKLDATTKPDDADVVTDVTTDVTTTAPVVSKQEHSPSTTAEHTASPPETKTNKDDCRSPPKMALKTSPKKAVAESNDGDVPVWFAMARRKTKKFEDNEGKKATTGLTEVDSEKTDTETEASIVLREPCSTTAPTGNRKSKVMDLVKNWQNLQVS